jgi:hypothetical protein
MLDLRRMVAAAIGDLQKHFWHLLATRGKPRVWRVHLFAGTPGSEESARSSRGDTPDGPAPAPAGTSQGAGAGASSVAPADDLAQSLANMKIARTQQQLAAAAGTVSLDGVP